MQRSLWTGVICTIAAVGFWGVAAVSQGHDAAPADPHHSAAPADPHHSAGGPATQPSGGSAANKEAVAARLAELKSALDNLEKAINAGDKDVSLAKLQAVRQLLAKAAAAANGFANIKCPIQGGSFDPATISANLARPWNGQKVGFCCDGCPQEWDKLTDAQKQAKLDAAK